MKHYLNGLYRGKVETRYGLQTAINKQPAEGLLYLSATGLEDDECADLRHHGGLDRALHHYPIEHYAFWQKKYGQEFKWCAPGMGENISTVGMTETTVCLGDRYQWGETIIEVSQPRSPCYRLNKRWGINNLSTHMQAVSRCGWLYRVIQPGLVSIHDPLVLIAQEDNAITLHEVCELFFDTPLNQEGLLKLKQQPKLSASWMSKVNARITTNEVEPWGLRLLGVE
ncbi:MOSC domain-containing protein [Reinekea sp.]|jgi:MOSC domain-containing protein YiiM|uniref:MOSC domain-containing protein n=1 Tax=Reinekea sp. TaxID=1970455 RepID=UPI003989606A